VIGIADHGFDKGVASDVHPAFAGRVLAVLNARTDGSTDLSDTNGHGTHVAGCALGSLTVKVTDFCKGSHSRNSCSFVRSFFPSFLPSLAPSLS
jgi:hypothetical protein